MSEKANRSTRKKIALVDSVGGVEVATKASVDANTEVVSGVIPSISMDTAAINTVIDRLYPHIRTLYVGQNPVLPSRDLLFDGNIDHWVVGVWLHDLALREGKNLRNATDKKGAWICEDKQCRYRVHLTRSVSNDNRYMIDGRLSKLTHSRIVRGHPRLPLTI